MATQDQVRHCINYIHKISASDEDTADYKDGGLV